MEYCNGSGVGGRAKGPATILAIGTANPPTCFHQDEYPDYYFRVTKSEHMTELKSKFERFCEKSMISKRYMHVDEKVLKENPSFVAQMAPSFDNRLDVEIKEVPKLAAEAAKKAIIEWGQPKSKITHLVFHSTLGLVMPGVDYELVHLLGLDLSVNRTMLYQLGCYAGGTLLRVAKDIAENNTNARVLVVCCEVMVNAFRAPNEAHMDILVGHAIFGDGAAAMIIGSDPDLTIERPIFEIISANQTIIPDTHDRVGGRFREVGLIYYLSKDLCHTVADNISKCVDKACKPLGITDSNSMFWMVHTGGPNILDWIEKKLNLNTEKLDASRKVLREYGNMWSTSVLFVIDEMRKKSIAQGSFTTGEGLKWGVALGFGPGVTVETVIFRSVPLVEH